jgi:sterol desaturase/sphingolipid hydroxylase (fatty acid hydroxylase superfamily)
MELPSISSAIEFARWFYAYIRHTSELTFISPGGSFSLLSLGSALLIAVAYLLWRRKPGRRPIRLKVLARAIFPKRIIGHRSAAFDVWMFMINTFAFSFIFGWAILSFQMVSSFVNGQLVGWFGALAPSTMSWLTIGVIMTVALFIAYEFGYWLDHYLSHRVPFLWEFHKVHHTAEVLTPLTNYRVHPGDTLVFVNILALTMGGTEGLLNYAFGKPVAPFTLWSNNIIILAGTYLIDHLHHTHFWIAFTGFWGKVFVSPAHHQIHHSTNPIHFNKNMGSCLSIFDWMFGTLHLPQKEREKLTFGVEEDVPVDQHSWKEGVFMPFLRAPARVLPALTWPIRTLTRLIGSGRRDEVPATKVIG